MCCISAVTLLWLLATAAPGRAAENGEGNLTPANAGALRPVFTLATGSPGAYTPPPVREREPTNAVDVRDGRL